MISFVLYKKSFQLNYRLIIIFMGVLAMYLTIIAGMYDPNDLDIINQLAELKLSPDLLAAMGFTLVDTSLIGFISSYFYGLLMLAFPMICYIILSNRLVASLVDKGSMANILSTPVTRNKVIITQGLFNLSAITAIIAFITFFGIAFCKIKFSGLLDVKAFLMLNLGVLLLHFALSGICFFASCLFNESKHSLMLGAGLPILFLLLQMLANTNSDIKIFKYLTLFSLFKPLDIIHGNSNLLEMGALALIAVVLYFLSIVVFDKKDLPI